ncbi:hypothetical protein Trydic_g21024 [Trypoxylus dichotomus]
MLSINVAIVTATIFILHLMATSAQYADRRPTVRLEQGLLTGFTLNGNKNRIDVFLGIPYVAPPIDNLRFTPPRKHFGWNGTLDASNYPPPCPQIPRLDGQNEDCLYLNVWTPEYRGKYALKPVVIFFEGLEFSRSNKIPVSGQELAAEDVIVVTANYRLNIFGFLCLGIPEARGNLGLLDQYFAMLWVKRNIERFGGNSDKITVFGHSAGAASAVLHLISPRTNGLFQRIILSSGSPTSSWHMSKNPFAASRKFAEMLKCSGDEPKTVLKCMQSKSTFEILKTYQDFLEVANFDLFSPVVDDFLLETDKYLPNDPIKSLKEGTYVQVPITVGISKLVVDSQFERWNSLAGQGYLQLQRYMEQIKIPEILARYNLGDGVNRAQIVELFKWRYVTPSRNNVNTLLNLLYRLEFDAKVETPHLYFLNLIESTYIEPIYVYDLEFFDLLLNVTDLTITADILLLFGSLLPNRIGGRHFSPKEVTPSRQFKEYIKNFITYGNPAIQRIESWRRYVPDGLNDRYVEYLNESRYKTDEEIISRNRRYSFWTQLLPKLSQISNDRGNIYATELSVPNSSAGFKHAMYTLIGLVVALLILLAICIYLLKKSYKERDRHLHMIY